MSLQTDFGPDSGGRVKGLVIVKPIVYGNIACYFGKKREEDGHTHQWTVYVKPYDNEDMSYVKKVHFKLHESYTNPNRIVTKPPYELTETGWGEFEIVIKIYFHDPNERPVTLYHILKLFQSPVTEGAPPVVGRTLVSESYEEIVFQEPTQLMQHLLSSVKPFTNGTWTHDTDFEDKKDNTLQKIIAAQTKVRSEILELKEKLHLAKETISKFKDEIAKLQNNDKTAIMDFVIGGLAGAGATIFTNPMDVVKTRLQLQGELRSRSEHAARYRGIFHGLYVIARADGVLALQKGLLPAMVFGFAMNSVRLGMYHVAQVQGWTKNTKGEISIEKTIFWSSASGVLSGVAANPASVLKTRMQAASHPSVAVGKQHRYKGILDGCIKMYKTEGLRGFFAGVSATCTRLAIGSAAQLTTFSTFKVLLREHGYFENSPIMLAIVASVVCSVPCICLETPLDVVNTRLYNQGTGANGEVVYKGVFDCLSKIYKTEGIHGLYKGIGPLYLRIAPHTTLSLVIWDLLNNLLINNKK